MCVVALSHISYRSPSYLSLTLFFSAFQIDFGLWQPDKKQVPKEKVSARIISVAWSSDGATLALGLITGIITLRNLDSEETHRIERKAPVWCLSFIPGAVASKTSAGAAGAENEMLAVGCWDKTLTFYKILPNGASKAHTERTLKYYPTSLVLAGNNVASKSHYLIISGSNKKVSLYSKEGIRLADLTTKDSWIWGAAYQPAYERVLVGTNSGDIDMLQLNFETVHALYKEKYAYRENLTDIVIHHLTADRKVRIKCKDIIRRISLYKNKLAVQLSDKVCVYESNIDETQDMHFRARKERMTISDKQCDMMLVTSEHLIFCVGPIVELYTFDGKRQRIWRMEANINFITVDGGPEGKEGLLMGMDNGVVSKIYVDNPFPVELMKRDKKIICLDVSLYRSKIASVDVNNLLTVTDLLTKDIIFSTQGVLSVCFNSEVDDMLCYTTDTSIYVVSGIGTRSSAMPEPAEQHTQGVAVGFQGQKIYCLHRGVIQAIDVPQSSNIQRAIDAGDMQGAYAVACFGATETNWRQLAMRALRANSLKVAKNAFERLKDIKYLTLIDTVLRESGEGGEDDRMPVASNQRGAQKKKTELDPVFQAELLAYEGHHHEAAKIYIRIGRHDEAIRIFTDLRNWKEAKTFAQSSGQMDLSALTMQQAQWLKEIHDWKGASDMYMSMGQYSLAASIIAESQEAGWEEKLIELVRQAPVTESREALLYCGEAFSNADSNEYAREAYKKVGEVSSLMNLYAKKKMWIEAGKLAEEADGKFDLSVMLPYAEWLVSQDKYEDAMAAFKRSGRADLAHKVLSELTANAVSESRFKDAAYYFWMMGKECEIDDSEQQMMCECKADLYFAYATIHSYVVDPFTAHQPETLFQVARFIINSLGNSEVYPFGISKSATLYTLARQAMVLGAYKLSRFAYDRLGKLQVPASKQAEVEMDMLSIQAKPIRDNADVLPVCFRCSATNPLLNPFTSKYAKGDVCTNCGHPFVRSFITFDVLPLVEFVPEPSITDEEAIKLIRRPAIRVKLGSGMNGGKTGGRGGDVTSRGQWNESKHGGADTLHLDEDYHDRDGASKSGDNEGDGDGDSFHRYLNIALNTQNNSYVAVTVDRSTLLAMNRTEVFVCRPSSKNKRATFYRNMLPDIAVAISQPCHRFFHLEDFEFSYLSTRSCPYSRFKNVGEYGSL